MKIEAKYTIFEHVVSSLNITRKSSGHTFSIVWTDMLYFISVLIKDKLDCAVTTFLNAV